MSSDPRQPADARPRMHVLRGCRGRALHVDARGALYRSLHYRIYRSDDDGRTWTRAAVIGRPLRRAVIEPIRLLCRMLRHEVRALATLSDGTLVAAVRSGVYFGPPDGRRMQRAAVEPADADLRFPTALAVGPADQVLWGEYWGNHGRRPVRVFASDDRGRSYRLAHEFAAGEIRHVHNLLYDPARRGYWLFSGDHDDEPGIGLLAADFSRFDWLVKGSQLFRAVCAFDLGDHLVYATDTEMQTNAILRLEKATGRIERLAEIGGSCIYACRCGPFYVLSSTVERIKGAGRFSRSATMYASADGDRWQPIYSRRKDALSYKYFQFGSLVLPRGESPRAVLMFSGQAVRKIDGKVLIAELTADGPA